MLFGLLGLMGLGAAAQKCPATYKRVKNPQGQFVCIPKKPCQTGYRWNAKEFACVLTPATQRQMQQVPGQIPGLAPNASLYFGQQSVAPGYDPFTGYPSGQASYPAYPDPFGFGFPGQIPGLPTVNSYPGAPYPGQPYPALPGMACAAGLTQDPYTGQCVQSQGPSALYPYGTPQAGQCAPGTVLNPQTGQCVNPITGQYVGMPLSSQYGYQYSQPLPYGGQMPGPSALYPYGSPQPQPSPYGGYGGFAPTPQPAYAPTSQYGGYGPPGASFDQPPDVGDGTATGSDDFIPDDVPQ